MTLLRIKSGKKVAGCSLILNLGQFGRKEIVHCLKMKSILLKD